MGFSPPTCLSHLLRDDLRLKLTCDCGHTAWPDILQLRADLLKVAGSEELTDLTKRLRCHDCDGRSVRYELIRK